MTDGLKAFEDLLLSMIAANTATAIAAKIENDPTLTIPAAAHDVADELEGMGRADGLPQEFIDLMRGITYDVGDAMVATALAEVMDCGPEDGAR